MQQKKKLKSQDTFVFHNTHKKDKCICQIRQILNSLKSTTILEIPVDILNAGLTTSSVQNGHANEIKSYREIHFYFMWRSFNHFEKKMIRISLDPC